MKRFLRVAVIVSVGLELAYLLFALIFGMFSTGDVQRPENLVIFGCIVLGLGCLLFQIRKLKSQYQSVEMETALDETFAREDEDEIKIPSILSFANTVFGVLMGVIVIGSIVFVNKYSIGNLPMTLTIILVTVPTYTFLYIAMGIVVKFIRSDMNAASKSNME